MLNKTTILAGAAALVAGSGLSFAQSTTTTTTAEGSTAPVNAMLLNEFLKEHRSVTGQQSTIAELERTVAQQ